MLLAVVQPMPGSPRSDDSLQLIGLHPNQFINTLIPVDNKINVLVHTCIAYFLFTENKSKINELEELIHRYCIHVNGL